LPPRDPAVADPRPSRVAALAASLESEQVDGLLITGLANVRYLTGFSGTSALLFATARGELLFVTDFRYQTQARSEIGDLARVVIEPQNLWSGLWRQLSDRPYVEVAGFEAAHLVYRDFQRLVDAGARWRWRPTADLVERLRERKDQEEVEHIRAAAAMATTALGQTIGVVHEGMTELEVAGVLEKHIRDAGSESFPFPSIVASGPRSALPHARSSSRVLERGELLLIDFGAATGGYCADITRTFVVGRASDEQRALHTVVRDANERAARDVRAGMSGREADALARDYIESCGFGEEFGHGLGHGLGLEVHEAPRLARSADAKLSVGAVVTIEPGIYRPDWGGVRIEDDVHLRADGPEVLSSFTHELLELG
jgi:Xaa-Pro aminopeptidase